MMQLTRYNTPSEILVSVERERERFLLDSKNFSRSSFCPFPFYQSTGVKTLKRVAKNAFSQTCEVTFSSAFSCSLTSEPQFSTQFTSSLTSEGQNPLAFSGSLVSGAPFSIAFCRSLVSEVPNPLPFKAHYPVELQLPQLFCVHYPVLYINQS